MLKHEGVVGVGVLPIDIDSYESEEQSNTIQTNKTSTSSFSNNIPLSFPDTKKPPVLQNHFSLMEEEEEENHYQSMITSQTT